MGRDDAGGCRSGGSGGERDREVRADHGDAAEWQRRCARGERGAAAAASARGR